MFQLFQTACYSWKMPFIFLPSILFLLIFFLVQSVSAAICLNCSQNPFHPPFSSLWNSVWWERMCAPNSSPILTPSLLVWLLLHDPTLLMTFFLPLWKFPLIFSVSYCTPQFSYCTKTQYVSYCHLLCWAFYSPVDSSWISALKVLLSSALYYSYFFTRLSETLGWMLLEGRMV